MVLVPSRGAGYFMDQPAEGTWSFIVEPVDITTTRLILRGRSGPKRNFSDRFWNHVFWEPAHVIMERKMMMTIKALAEQPHNRQFSHHESTQHTTAH
jgi:hypothetical protein